MKFENVFKIFEPWMKDIQFETADGRFGHKRNIKDNDDQNEFTILTKFWIYDFEDDINGIDFLVEKFHHFFNSYVFVVKNDHHDEDTNIVFIKDENGRRVVELLNYKNLFVNSKSV